MRMTMDDSRNRPIALQRAVEQEATMTLAGGRSDLLTKGIVNGKLLFSYRLVAQAATIATLRELAKELGPNAIIDKYLAQIVGDGKLVRQSLCAHESVSGGNDYHLCNDCHLTWDYRTSSATQALHELLTMLLRERVKEDVALVELSQDDIARLTTLLENAEAEVDASASTDSTVQPDDASALMSSYNWSQGLRTRLQKILVELE